MMLFDRIKKWWDGHPYENDPNSQVVFFCMVYPKPRVYWDNIKKHMEQHWQFWIGTTIAVLGLWFSIFKQGG